MRLAFGPCSCIDAESGSEVQKAACGYIKSKMDSLKSLSFSQLSSYPKVETGEANLSGFDFKTAVQIEDLSGKLLVVVQLFHSTWKFPTFISKNGVGKMFVEGIEISPDGTIAKADDEKLWEYR